MKRKMNPNSLANLKNNKCRFKDKEKAAEAGRKGGASEERKKAIELRKCLEILLEKDTGKDKQGNMLNGAEALSVSIFKKAMSGDVRAFEVIRDTIGQKPIDKVMVSDVDADTIADVERMVRDAAESGGSD